MLYTDRIFCETLQSHLVVWRITSSYGNTTRLACKILVKKIGGFLNDIFKGGLKLSYFCLLFHMRRTKKLSEHDLQSKKQKINSKTIKSSVFFSRTHIQTKKAEGIAVKYF